MNSKSSSETRKKRERKGVEHVGIIITTAPSTSLLAFDWAPTYVSLTSVLAERPLTQEDCTVCHAEGATVALRGTTT